MARAQRKVGERQIEERAVDKNRPLVDDIRRLVAFAHARCIPVTLRGAGTGNYGQCIPTHGGIVLDLAALDRIPLGTAAALEDCPQTKEAVVAGDLRKAAVDMPSGANTPFETTSSKSWPVTFSRRYPAAR